MPRRLTLLAIGACANALVAPAWAQAAPEVTLTRLDCGTPRGAVADLGFSFSDTFGDSVPNIRLVFSCYLIKHGDDYMVWDTGWGMSAGPVAPKTSLIDLLAQVNVKPEQIKYVGISHYHADHVGQVTSFPKATLLIGKGLLQQAAAACAEAMPLRLLRLHNTCDARTCNAYYRLLMSGVLRQCEACGAFWGRPQEEETFSSYG